MGRRAGPSQPSENVCAVELRAGTLSFLPGRSAVLFKHKRPASGNSHLEALCHATCEVIERDATALAVARSHVRPGIAAMLTDIGFNRHTLPEPEYGALISLTSLPRKAGSLVHKLQRAGFRVYLRNLTSDLGIATIGCVIVDPGSSSVISALVGSGHSSGRTDRGDPRSDRGGAIASDRYSGRPRGLGGYRAIQRRSRSRRLRARRHDRFL